MCQTLHIPYKHQPTDVQMKMNWLAIERWANHIVTCCCTKCKPWELSVNFPNGFVFGGESSDNYTFTESVQLSSFSIFEENSSDVATITLHDSTTSTVITTFSIVGGSTSYTFNPNLSLEAGTYYLSTNSSLHSNGESGLNMKLDLCSDQALVGQVIDWRNNNG